MRAAPATGHAGCPGHATARPAAHTPECCNLIPQEFSLVIMLKTKKLDDLDDRAEAAHVAEQIKHP